MIRQTSFHSPSKQKGATLVTVLVFVSLMTVVSVSSTKVSILDIMISANEQQKAESYQKSENNLTEITTVVQLYKPLTGASGAAFATGTNIYPIPTQDSNASLKIFDPEIRYECNGFNGRALSLGPSVPRCDLYDFEAAQKNHHTGSGARHNRGAGKEMPNLLKNSYLTE